MDYKKSFFNTVFIIELIVLVGAIGYLIAYAQILLPKSAPLGIACTMEAKICPDGSAVGRSGPQCEFAKCPSVSPIPNPIPNPSGKQIILYEGQKEGSLLLQKIYPTYITGLNFREYPVATDQGQLITLYVGETASNGCTITLTLIKIEGKAATFIEKTDFNKPCPICLAENTLIDTPNGALPVQHLQKGMAIWTVDESGNKISTTIIKASKTPVPKTHQMVHIILEDKREIFASPGHPIGDGRVFSDLSAGDTLNGSKIIITEKTAYRKGYTYDVLPSGNNGLYFANGILIGSTLHQ